MSKRVNRKAAVAAAATAAAVAAPSVLLAAPAHADHFIENDVTQPDGGPGVGFVGFNDTFPELCFFCITATIDSHGTSVALHSPPLKSTATPDSIRLSDDYIFNGIAISLSAPPGFSLRPSKNSIHWESPRLHTKRVEHDWSSVQASALSGAFTSYEHVTTGEFQWGGNFIDLTARAGVGF